MKYLSAMWVGIQKKYPGKLTTEYDIWEKMMIGVVIRSARLKQLGNFMYGQVSINGKKMWAGGAEDRIFPFHHVTLEHDEKEPKDMVPAMGFCRDGNGYAFNYKGAPRIIVKAAVCGMDAAFEVVPPENHPDVWVVK